MTRNNPYETNALLRQYLDFHYRSLAPDYLPHHALPPGVLDYPRRCARALIERASTFDRALDLGCAVGGAGFALATAFSEVIGVDASAAFIRAANTLAREGVFRMSEHTYAPPSEPRKNPPVFQTGDACRLSPDLGAFDAILMANLLCRVPDPAACLRGLRPLARPGAVLFFATPCSWDEAFTPRDRWLTPMLEGLHHHLDEWCDRLDVFDMPFVLRVHERRAEYTVAQASVWKVRGRGSRSQ